MTATSEASTRCLSCSGSGEIPSDSGMLDCPDCGGIGEQPPHATRVEWRARDILRSVQAGRAAGARDVEWLLSQLEGARFALTQILSLAQELEPTNSHAIRIRFAANAALGLYDVDKKP